MKLNENSTLNDYVAVHIPNTPETIDALGYFLDKFDKNFIARNGIDAFVIKVRDLKNALDEVDLDLDRVNLYEVDDKLVPVKDEEIFDKLAFIYDADEVEDDGEDRVPEVKRYSTEEIANMAGPAPEAEVPDFLKKYFDKGEKVTESLDSVWNKTCDALGKGINKVCNAAADSNLLSLSKSPDSSNTLKGLITQTNKNVVTPIAQKGGAFMNTLANSKLFKATESEKVFERVFRENYYDDPVNHPEGGGTCDICGKEVQPGDGYEPDFESSFETARDGIYERFTGRKYLDSPAYELARYMGIDEDELDDVVMDIVRDAFGDAKYICPDCAHEKIREAAFHWVEDNYEVE